MKRDDPLDPVLEAARAHVQSQLDSGGRVRDFAAMISRARALDPSAVSADALAEVADYAPVVVLRRPTPTPTPTPMPAPGPVAAPHPRGRGATWVGVAIAAMVLLGLAGAASLARRSTDAPTSNAVQHLGPAPTRDEARPAPTPNPPSRRAPPRVEPTTTPVLEPIAEPLVEPMVEPGTAPVAKPIVEPAPIVARPPDPPISRRPAPIEVKPPTGAELDRRAREAWRRGELDEARRLFGLLIAADDDPRLVELAFGDLLVLARQTRDDRGLERARRAYLARFPAGIYADDASAGLCRDVATPVICWTRYLEDRPTGAHVDEARRVLAKSVDTP